MLAAKGDSKLIRRVTFYNLQSQSRRNFSLALIDFGRNQCYFNAAADPDNLFERKPCALPRPAAAYHRSETVDNVLTCSKKVQENIDFPFPLSGR